MGHVFAAALFFGFMVVAFKALTTSNEEYVLEEIHESNGDFRQRFIPEDYLHRWADIQPQAAIATDLVAILYAETTTGQRMEVVEYFGYRIDTMCYNFSGVAVSKGDKPLRHGSKRHKLAFELLAEVQRGLSV